MLSPFRAPVIFRWQLSGREGRTHASGARAALLPDSCSLKRQICAYRECCPLHDRVGAALSLVRMIARSAWRRSSDTPIDVGEIALTRETHGQRDVADRLPSLGEHGLRALDALARHELMRRQPGGLLEAARKVKRAHVDQHRETVDRQLVGEVGPDERADAFELLRRKRRGAPVFRGNVAHSDARREASASDNATP